MSRFKDKHGNEVNEGDAIILRGKVKELYRTSVGVALQTDSAPILICLRSEILELDKESEET